VLLLIAPEAVAESEFDITSEVPFLADMGWTKD
jgi:hypothetical protein